MNKPLPPELVPQPQEPSRERTLAQAQAVVAALFGSDDSFLLMHIHPDGAVATCGVTATVQDSIGIVGAALSGLRTVADYHGQQDVAGLAGLMLKMLGLRIGEIGGILHRPAPPLQ